MELNTEAIKSSMQSKGLSQADLSRELSVSREAVSKWLSNESLPRPGRVARLANILSLSFDEIYVNESVAEPIVAFRKKGTAKTKSYHLERAKDMAAMLGNLVSYLPFDLLTHPASFIDPKPDIQYVIQAAGEIRSRMSLNSAVVDFNDIIDFFAEVHAVIVPVMYGKRDQHENAMHVYLPDSRTSWVYLNLETKIMDFKFWMAHELAHVKCPTLSPEESELFADRFAAELLFPASIAEKHFSAVSRLKSRGSIVTAIQEIAEEYLISPITVLSQLNHVATSHGDTPIEVNIHPSTTNFNKSFRDVDEILFGTGHPTPANYLRISREVFATPFFDALTGFLRDSGKEFTFIQRALNIGPLDAKSLHRALIHG
jgi:transcriptional regulator with XRE-family HTH domain